MEHRLSYNLINKKISLIVGKKGTNFQYNIKKIVFFIIFESVIENNMLLIYLSTLISTHEFLCG
jgi:mannitol/fructose-specific phosphotransferase system IIA component (Ntr-type)